MIDSKIWKEGSPPATRRNPSPRKSFPSTIQRPIRKACIDMVFSGQAILHVKRGQAPFAQGVARSKGGATPRAFAKSFSTARFSLLEAWYFPRPSKTESGTPPALIGAPGAPLGCGRVCGVCSGRFD